MKLFARSLAFLILSLAAGAARGDSPDLPLAAVPDFNRSLPQKNSLNDAFWAKAADLGPMNTMDAGTLPEVETTARIAATPQGLCVRVHCADPDMAHLMAARTKRNDFVYTDDCVELFVQPPGVEYRHFIVNPLGTEQDELGRDARWDAQWTVKTARHTDGWDAEIVIGWAAFGGRPKAGDVWRFNVGRERPRAGASKAYSWSPTNAGFHRPERFGFLHFGAPVWVSQLHWGARWQGLKQVTAMATPSSHPGTELRQTATRLSSDADGLHTAALRFSANGTEIARFLYTVENSSLPATLISANQWLAKVNSSDPRIADDRDSLHAELTALRHSAATADRHTLAVLEDSATADLLRASALVPRAALPLALKSPLPTLAYGEASSLDRLLPIDAFDGQPGGGFHLTGARNEIADAQLFLFAYEQPALGITLAISELRGPGGATIPSSALRWRHVGQVRTAKPGYATRYVGLWPDPLLPAAPFDIASYGRESVWMDAHIPTDAAPGDYAGTITVTSPGAAALTVPLTLHIWGFTIPHENHLVTAFNGGHFADTDNEALWDNMQAHRISPMNSVGKPKEITPSVNGSAPVYDWTEFDRTVQHRLDLGMTSFVASYYEAAPARVWQEHLAQKGWLKYAFSYIWDEPQPNLYPDINTRFRELKIAAPRLKTFVTAFGFPPQLPYVDIWCPDMTAFDPAQAGREQARGRNVWWYTAYDDRHPFPNFWVDYPLLDCRIVPWATWKHDVDGLLYWEVTNWGANPWQNPMSFSDANGDGNLLYPGPNRTQIDSMRWECLRDGLQDYEVFCLLEAGARELAATGKAADLVKQAQSLTAIDDSVVRSFKDYNQDPRALLQARDQMSRVLEQIVSTLGHEPTIVGRPRYRPGLSAAELAALK